LKGEKLEVCQGRGTFWEDWKNGVGSEKEKGNCTEGIDTFKVWEIDVGGKRVGSRKKLRKGANPQKKILLKVGPGPGGRRGDLKGGGGKKESS